MVFVTDYGLVRLSKPFVERFKEIDKYRLTLKNKKKSQKLADDELTKLENAISQISEVYWRAGKVLTEI